MDTIEADVCIVGAGLAGLAAAYKLQQASTSSIVLEAGQERKLPPCGLAAWKAL